MTKAAHTPGPWELREGSTVYVPAGYKPYSYRIVECLGYKNEREANARLIAEAPTMLEALRRIVAMRDTLEHQAYADFAPFDAAAAILARIDGE